MTNNDQLAPEPQDGVFEDLDVESGALDEDQLADVESLAMFEGDTSELYEDQRRCLHALLKHRYISAERHPAQWAVLMASEALMRSRLNELFLELHVDRQHRVAFKRQAVGDAGEALPSLLREVVNTKEDTILMVHLRQRFFAKRQDGEDIVFVERHALLAEVSDHRPENTTNRSIGEKRANKAIESLASAGVLLKTGDPDRFRISPIIEVLMPIERLRSLWTWLMTQNGIEPQDDDETHPDSEELDDELDLLTGLETEEEDA